MTMTHDLRPGMRVLAAVLAAMTVGTVACSRSTDPDEGDRSRPDQSPPTSTIDGKASPAPTASLPTVQTLQPDRGDPIEVGEALLTLIYTRNTVSEPGYSDSIRRAAPLMTPPLVADLTKPSPGVRPLPQWVRWTNQRARVEATVTVAADEHPADTDRQVSRVFLVAEQPITDTGLHLREQTTASYVTMTKEGSQWSVSAVSFGG
jgi:hypothetical protein